jgi:hypothetical protein
MNMLENEEFMYQKLADLGELLRKGENLWPPAGIEPAPYLLKRLYMKNNNRKTTPGAYMYSRVGDRPLGRWMIFVMFFHKNFIVPHLYRGLINFILSNKKLK